LMDGMAQRGQAPNQAVRAWAGELAKRWAERLTQGNTLAWTGDLQTFGMDKREKPDGKSLAVISSLPPPRSQEIEIKTGSILSAPFVCPPQLSFWLCGHNGNPELPDTGKNFVTLLESATQKELRHATPPRQDQLQRVQWDLKDHAGKSVQLRIQDQEQSHAYAWLALGGVEPPVVSLTLPNPNEDWKALGNLVGKFSLTDLAAPLVAAFHHPDLNDTVRLAIAQALQKLPDTTPQLVQLFKTASSRQQTILAEVLVSTQTGARQLCELAPPRLLTVPTITQKISSFKDTELNRLYEQRTKNLPPAAAETEQLINQRLAGFLKARAEGKADAAKGQVVFAAQCALCHQMAGQGKLVGPQLDGTKNRGAERLCEDILDPNRAVDPVFHLHLVKLSDQSILSGLQRREEGETLVFADAAGQEHRVAKSSIVENAESPLSLMPPTFAQTLTESDFYHLMAYLIAN
jgi:putative heme-binding domain-containing protein